MGRRGPRYPGAGSIQMPAAPVVVASAPPDGIPPEMIGVPDVAGRDLRPPSDDWSAEWDPDHFRLIPTDVAPPLQNDLVCRRCGALVLVEQECIEQHDRFHRLLAHIDRDSRLGRF
jgi:hypothetical protein